MKFNKKTHTKLPLLILAHTFFVFLTAFGQATNFTYDEIELVESIPIETSLDIANIRNTPEVWQEMISNAKTSLDIETFYISSVEGEPLEIILTEIKKAASRGVKIRIISEAKFKTIYAEPLVTLAEIGNIEVRIIDFGKIAGGVMHAKYFIVDNEQIFLGSQNFDWRSLKHIHELGVRVRNKSIAKLFTKLFNADWIIAKENIVAKNLFTNLKYAIPIFLNLPDRKTALIPVFSPINFLPYKNLWDEPQIVAMINNAETEINIQLLTYSPEYRGKTYYEVLDNALRKAAARGVKVKLLCSDWSKRHPTIDHLKSLSLVPNIEVKLSKIPEHTAGFIPYARVDHCKYLLVDSDRFWIGTSNWSKDYFYNSRNVGFIINELELAKTVKKFFENSWNSPYAYFVDPCKEYKPPKVSGN